MAAIASQNFVDVDAAAAAATETGAGLGAAVTAALPLGPSLPPLVAASAAVVVHPDDLRHRKDHRPASSDLHRHHHLLQQQQQQQQSPRKVSADGDSSFYRVHARTGQSTIRHCVNTTAAGGSCWGACAVFACVRRSFAV